MAAPIAEEEQLLVKFRDRVKDILEREDQQENSFLIRWLRARDHELDQAERMLRTSLAWRKEHKIDFILELPVDKHCQEEYPYFIHGIDKHGQPVVLIPMGKWDFRKCVLEGKTEDFQHYINRGFEEVVHTIERFNKSRDHSQSPVTQTTIIMDFKGYSYMQLCNVKALQNLLYSGITHEAHYPEFLSSCLLLNCPSFFNVVVLMLKQLMAAKTFGKVTVYGTNREEWEKALRDIIDDECQLDGVLKLLS